MYTVVQYRVYVHHVCNAVRYADKQKRDSDKEIMKVLQISSSNMEFFQEQVRILENKGVECDVVYATSKHTDKHGLGNGLHTTILNQLYGHNSLYYGARGLTFFPEVLTKSIKNQYDLIHINGGMVLPFAIAQPRRPIVATLWGDDLLSNRFYGLQKQITKTCVRRTSDVIVRSEEMAQELPCDSHIIPSGVDLDKFRTISRQKGIDLVGWDTEKKHILFPYNPAQSKKRYPLAKDVVDDLDSEMESDLELQTIHGVPHDRMYLYYNAADVLLLPSLREGSPNTVKEAMACNLPVVSTDVGDVKERLGPVQNCFVCDSDRELKYAIERVLDTNSRSNGRSYVEEVSLNSMGDRIISIYKNNL